jgi:hypothetical protein
MVNGSLGLLSGSGTEQREGQVLMAASGLSCNLDEKWKLASQWDLP